MESKNKDSVTYKEIQEKHKSIVICPHFKVHQKSLLLNNYTLFCLCQVSFISKYC